MWKLTASKTNEEHMTDHASEGQSPAPTESEVTELLRRGISLAKAGSKAEARPLLMQAAMLNPRAELAWLWMAWVAESPQDALIYVEKVLAINPNNEQAQRWLSKIKQVKGFKAAIYSCFLCGLQLETKVVKCPKCRGVLSLADIDALLNNEDVDRAVVRRVLESFEGGTFDATHADFTRYFNLGLAYLNDKRFDEGIFQLHRAAELRPEDIVLRSQVHVLERRAQALKDQLRRQQQQKVVFVIDDSPTVRKLVAVTLERQGYRVIVAPDGIQALAKIEETQPELIFLDITMPYMDGYQVCKVLRGNPKTKKVPIVMLSGKDGIIDKMRARLVGASAHVSKPVDPNTLLATVRKFVKAT